MNATNWKELIVTDAEGDTMGTLGEMVKLAPANLDGAVIQDGKITEWPQFFLSADGEEPDYDTPRGDVDWNGFVDTLNGVLGIRTDETYGSGMAFEDTVVRYLETLDQNLDVTYDGAGEFRIQTEEGGDFNVQVCPRDEYESLLENDEIFAGAIARLRYDGSRFLKEITVDGSEYVVIPQA